MVACRLAGRRACRARPGDPRAAARVPGRPALPELRRGLVARGPLGRLRRGAAGLRGGAQGGSPGLRPPPRHDARRTPLVATRAVRSARGDDQRGRAALAGRPEWWPRAPARAVLDGQRLPRRDRSRRARARARPLPGRGHRGSSVHVRGGTIVVSAGEERRTLWRLDPPRTVLGRYRSTAACGSAWAPISSGSPSSSIGPTRAAPAASGTSGARRGGWSGARRRRQTSGIRWPSLAARPGPIGRARRASC